MASAGTGGRAAVGGSGIILPGRHTPDAVPVLTPALNKVVALSGWFGHPDNDNFNGVSLSELPVNFANCNPAAAMTTLVSLEPMVPVAFLGLFPSNTTNLTMCLTEQRHQGLLDILSNIPKTQKCVSVNTQHKVLGELQSMSLALLGSGLSCSALHVQFKSDKKCVCLTNVVHNFPDNFWWMADTPHNCPAWICELAPTSPIAVSSTEACGVGMGWHPLSSHTLFDASKT